MLLGASGGANKLDDIVLTDNFTYVPAGGPYGLWGGGVTLGYHGGCLPSVSDSGGVYIASSSVQLTGDCRPGTFQGHTLIGDGLNQGAPILDAYPDSVAAPVGTVPAPPQPSPEFALLVVTWR